MAGSVNKVILVGNLGRDPEVRSFANGGRVVSFSLATTESWRDKATGERKDKTEWHNVQIFDEQLGKVAEQFLKKGAKVYLQGSLQTREFTDKDNNQRKTTEVVLQRFNSELVMLDGRRDGGGMGEGDYGASEGARSGGGGFGRTSPMERRPAVGGGGRAPAPMDDDIPF